MDRSFIKIYRQMSEWEWYKDSVTKSLFLHLLIKANWKESKWRGFEIKRGQLITGRKLLSTETGIKETTIERHLKRLEESGEIEQQTNNKNRVITVCNYDEYQSVESDVEQQTDNKRTTNGQQTDTSKKLKNSKKEILYPHKEIISYLNEKANKKYRHSTEKTKGLIQARINEGFSLEDFKTVIDIKCSDWLKDEEYNKYLRPETLFGNKFEGYLNSSSQSSETDNTCKTCSFFGFPNCKDKTTGCKSWTKR